MSDWFASWFDSPEYHLLYEHRNEEEALPFIEALVKHLDIAEDSKLLDIACGKGRHAKALSDIGHFVTGIDLSPNSIEEANKLSNERLSFFVHDMREVFRENEFDVSFNFFTSFGYFQNEADNKAAASVFVHTLKAGGRLVIDYVNQSHALRNIEEKGKTFVVKGDTRFDLDYRFEDGRYKKIISVEGRTFEESVQAFSLDDFKGFFENEGMQLTEVFGDYELSSYNADDSPRMIMIFAKS